MRIIAGRHRGHRLTALRGDHIRPTAARARETVFNILTHGGVIDRDPLIGRTVLDGFCGVGTLALEALSRGARTAMLLDNHPSALAQAQANAQTLGVVPICQFIMADATCPPAAPERADLFFLDPPYGRNLLPVALHALATAGWFAQGACGVAELGKREDFSLPEGFTSHREKRIGEGRFLFLTYGNDPT